MDQDAIIRYLEATFAGLEVQRPTDGPGAGDTFIFYDPQHDQDPTRRLPFATIVTKDYGEFDNRSQLDRPGIFRLNIGISWESFSSLFGHPPNEKSPKSTAYDFAALDHLTPHPVYAPQSWVSVLNPSPATFETVKPLLAEAYSIVVKRYPSRHRKPE